MTKKIIITQRKFFHYNKLKYNIFNWNDIHFPIGNRDIDRFEKNNKIISINIFKSDNCLNNNKIILYRGTKNKNIKCEIHLPKIFNKDNYYYYILVKNKCKLLNY